MPDVVVGIDGGGTKTRAVAVDLQGGVVARASSGAMNYHTVTQTESAAHIGAAIAGLLEQSPMRVLAVAIGDASIDDVSGYQPQPEFLEQIRQNARLEPGTPIHIKSDVYMALYGFTGGRPGALIISGTGSMGIGLDSRGQIHHAGGWGHPLTDSGSAYDIAVGALAAVYAAADGMGPPTPLTRAALDFFQAENPRGICYRLNGSGGRKHDIAAFAPMVTRAAGDGDPIAAGILDAAADALAAYACHLTEAVAAPGSPVGMYGGVFQHDTHVRERFVRIVGQKHPDSPVGFPAIPPERAAAQYLLDHLKLNKDG